MTQSAHETILGVLTQNAPVPVGIDPARLVVWEQRMGFSYQQLRGVIGGAIQEHNVEMFAAWGDAFYATPDQSVWYPQGGDVIEFEELAGGARPNPVKGGQAGHMIPMSVWGKAIGGDWRTLADMTMPRILASMKGIIAAGRDLFDRRLLNRVFDPTEYLLGATGYDVPFCNGSPGGGTTGPNYAPLKWGGYTFDFDHNHYLAVTAATTNPVTGAAFGASVDYGLGLEAIAFLVAEHGLTGNFKALISEADVTTIRALKNYVQPMSTIPWGDFGGRTAEPKYGEPKEYGSIPATGNRYVGCYNSAYGLIDLFANTRIPVHYAVCYRPGSVLNPTNALAVRYRPEWGLGFKVLDIPNEETTFPVKEIDIEFEFGVSCGQNREAAACMLYGTTPYAAPTIR
jgi:hypothetical protein